MNVVELFSGTANLARIARKRGHRVLTLDRDAEANMMVDIPPEMARAVFGVGPRGRPDCRSRLRANGGSARLHPRKARGVRATKKPCDATGGFG